MSRPLQSFDLYGDQPNLTPAMNRILDQKGAEQFLTLHRDDFYFTDLNIDLLIGFLGDPANGGPYPASLRNLEIAMHALEEDGVLEPRPPQAPEPVANAVVQRFTHAWGEDTRPKSATGQVLDPATAKAQADYLAERANRPSASENTQEIPDDAEFLQNVQDEPLESDAARKARDEALRRYAIAQRCAQAKKNQNYNRG
jgi:hypothetical protein